MRKSQLYSTAFGISLMVLLIFSLLLYHAINSLTTYSYAVEHSHQIMFNVQKLQSNVIDIETGQRGFLLTKDSSFLEPLYASRATIPLLLDTLQELCKNDTLQLNNIQRMKISLVKRLWILERTLNEYGFYSGDKLSARLKEGNVLMNQFRDQIKKIEKEEMFMLRHGAANKQTYERITPNYFKIIFSITTVIAFISFILLMQELRQRLASQNLLETRFHALNQSTSELQQIAHITSHDLQEPLRKIRTFSDVLISKYEPALHADGKLILNRISQNALRMQERIADLSSFASLSVSEGKIAAVDLTKTVLDVQLELASIIHEKKPKITVSVLPIIEGFADQLHILFRELMDNALKFSVPNVPPVITITANHVRGDQLDKHDKKYNRRNFTVINIYDQGIGFENEYADKIFVLFQRLHNADSVYSGKGIGLAICQRIMANHNGFISASSEIGKGATFRLYFPENENQSMRGTSSVNKNV